MTQMRTRKRAVLLAHASAICLVFWVTVSGATLVLLASSAQAAGLDCNAAGTQAEQRICRDPALSKLDETMNRAYRRARRAVAKDPQQQQALLNEQKGWLSSREWCDDDVYEGADCMTDIYRARIETLQGRASAAPPSIPHKPAYRVAWTEPEYKEMCHAMAENLNSLPAWPPMACERKLNPKFAQFQPLEWRYWSVDEFRQRWPLLNEIGAMSATPVTAETVESFVERIRSGDLGVAEVKLPAPPFSGLGKPNEDIGSYVRAGGIPRYQMSLSARRRDANLRQRLGLDKQYDYPIKYDEECRTAAASPVTKDGRHLSTSGGRTHVTSPQVWLYAPPGKPAITIEQEWAVIAPGFLWGTLVMNDKFTCAIRYFKPAVATTSGKQQ